MATKPRQTCATCGCTPWNRPKDRRGWWMTRNGKSYCGVDCLNDRAKETEKALRESNDR